MHGKIVVCMASSRLHHDEGSKLRNQSLEHQNFHLDTTQYPYAQTVAGGIKPFTPQRAHADRGGVKTQAGLPKSRRGIGSALAPALRAQGQQNGWQRPPEAHAKGACACCMPTRTCAKGGGDNVCSIIPASIVWCHAHGSKVFVAVYEARLALQQVAGSRPSFLLIAPDCGMAEKAQLLKGCMRHSWYARRLRSKDCAKSRWPGIA